MKILSWNVNGLRASLKGHKNLKEFLDGLGADIICFQETKATRVNTPIACDVFLIPCTCTGSQLDETLYLVDGYNAYFSFSQTRKGYSGVVTFCRDSVTPIAAEEGLSGVLPSSSKDTTVKCYGNHSQFTNEELVLLDSEGRAVLTEHRLASRPHPLGPGGEAGAETEKRLVVVNVYCPMYDPARDKEGEGLSRLHYKMNFYRLLEARCSALEHAGKVLLAVGDFNCSREAIDSAYKLEDPSLDQDSHPSIEWSQRFMVSSPPESSSASLIPSSPPSPPIPPSSTNNTTSLLDTFRYLHPAQKGTYTCWSTRLDSRKTNYGTRIDYILSSLSLADSLTRAEVWQHREGSDHCPVFAEFDLDILISDQCQLPALCSRWFTGKQSKLSDFMTRHATEEGGGAKEEGSRGTKRTRVRDAILPPAPKKSLGQKTLFAFSTSSQSVSKTMPSPAANVTSPPPTTATTTAASTGQLSGAWRSVFGGGPKAPLCSGHGEACVMRKVRKQGPNKDRQFWVCARPGGAKDDPKAQCNYFKWVKEKKK